MAKEIITRRGEVKAIRKLLGLTEATVINALRFRTKSELAEKIRKTAIDRGGVEIEVHTEK